MEERKNRYSSSVFRVLVVDDNRDAADSMCTLLKLWGFEAEAAYDGRNALAVARSSHPNCIISDIRMPGVDGYELARCMRQDESLRAATIIAVTANPDEVKAKIAGFDDQLTKPADPNAIKRILVRRQSVANWKNAPQATSKRQKAADSYSRSPFRAGVVDYLCGCRLNHWLWTP
jgi:CheY-like chemotaxis protein